jgi:hexosaminidase
MPRPWSARSWMSAIALISSTTFSPGLIAAQAPLMPMPAHVTQETGQFSIDRGFRIVLEGYTESRLERAVERFRINLTRETGILHFPDASPA